MAFVAREKGVASGDKGIGFLEGSDASPGACGGLELSTTWGKVVWITAVLKGVARRWRLLCVRWKPCWEPRRLSGASSPF